MRRARRLVALVVTTTLLASALASATPASCAHRACTTAAMLAQCSCNVQLTQAMQATPPDEAGAPAAAVAACAAAMPVIYVATGGRTFMRVTCGSPPIRSAPSLFLRFADLRI